ALPPDFFRRDLPVWSIRVCDDRAARAWSASARRWSRTSGPAFVECNLGARRLEIECGVPGTALGAVEAAAERMYMTERGVDDVRVRNAVQELVDADPRQQVGLTKQPVVGGALQLEQIVELARAV